MGVLKFVAHSQKVIKLSESYGWLPGAKYTNLRDLKGIDFEAKGFMDVDWKKYNFSRHLAAVQEKKPFITMARDVESIYELDSILNEADALSRYSTHVAIIPKDTRLNNRLHELIPKQFILAYSVPTRYGGTDVSIESFDRKVHLLGGRPDVQRKLADKLDVMSFDCNRFTLDAKYGYYFNGERFVKDLNGTYEKCLEKSLFNINMIWDGYLNSVGLPNLISQEVLI